ncbi:unnamed protein product [Choristocarpus tenellus]
MGGCVGVGSGGSGRDFVGYHGVRKENDAYRSFFIQKNQAVDLGLYALAIDAARAYDRKVRSIWGDSAQCNFGVDDQVEGESMGADGKTVKGVMRSFHQWRAEIQWGNKKRHLGFFDKLDDASYAYNRAALHAQGAGAAVLNPVKDGYMPPPPRGKPVRVPRHKLLVPQMLLLKRAQGQFTAEQERRRWQAEGTWHPPLVGDKHQVSNLPMARKKSVQVDQTLQKCTSSNLQSAHQTTVTGSAPALAPLLPMAGSESEPSSETRPRGECSSSSSGLSKCGDCRCLLSSCRCICGGNVSEGGGGSVDSSTQDCVREVAESMRSVAPVVLSGKAAVDDAGPSVSSPSHLQTPASDACRSYVGGLIGVENHMKNPFPDPTPGLLPSAPSSLAAQVPATRVQSKVGVVQERSEPSTVEPPAPPTLSPFGRDDAADIAAFSDIAELVWSPRPPLPRRKNVGGDGTGDACKGSPEAADAVTAAAWARDSDLLRRLAPAHVEKAMQVLQVCRHDPDRAAQVLSVRHGIKVDGMGVARTTRNTCGGEGLGLPLSSSPATGVQAVEVQSPRASFGGGGSWGGVGYGGVATDTPDAQGFRREEVSRANEAFVQHGRNLDAVALLLGWRKNRVVDYYYRVWKFSPSYQVWKATRHQAGLPVSTGGSVSSAAIPTRKGESGGGENCSGASNPVPLAATLRFSGVGVLPNASTEGMRWRGSRLRTLKAT